MKWIAVFFFVLSGVLGACASQIFLYDLFDDGVLSTSEQVNGGFTEAGPGNGSASEDDGPFARVSNAPSGSSYGILSASTFDWDPTVSGQDTLRTTWHISNSDLKKSTSLLTFVWQDAADTDFSAPEIRLEVDIVNSVATLYDESGFVGDVLVDVDFGQSNHAFRVITEFNADSAIFRGEGDLKTRAKDPVDAIFGASAGEWELPFFSGRPMRVGVENLASSNGGLVVDIASVKMEAIPEPAVVSFIAVFCVGTIFVRRIFVR